MRPLIRKVDAYVLVSCWLLERAIPRLFRPLVRSFAGKDRKYAAFLLDEKSLKEKPNSKDPRVAQVPKVVSTPVCRIGMKFTGTPGL